MLPAMTMMPSQLCAPQLVLPRMAAPSHGGWSAIGGDTAATRPDQNLRLRGGATGIKVLETFPGATRKKTLPFVLRAFVCWASGLWLWACLRALWLVLRAAVKPGGLEYLVECSSHGAPGVLLFVGFAATLAAVQAYKLVVVVRRAHARPFALFLMAIFDVSFVAQCGWRPSDGLVRVTHRDAVIMSEALLLGIIVLRQYTHQPWRSRGRRMS